MRDTNGITNNPVPATPSKKLAAQFSKAAKVKALTTLLRTEEGLILTRKTLKAFEKRHNLVVQWVARREDPVQNFRTPLGFVRTGRGAYAIPTDAASIPESVKTVTDVPGGPGRDVQEVTVPITVEAGEFPTSGVVEPSEDEQSQKPIGITLEV